MPKWLRTFLVPVAVLALVAAACGDGGGTGDGNGDVECNADLNVGVAYDIGGIGDKSFNDAANAGLQAAIDEGLVCEENTDSLEPDATGSNRDDNVIALAEDGNDLVIAVGFIFGPDLERLAVRFPNVKFAGVDYAPSAGFTVPPNLLALGFREQEGSFVVGAIAAMKTRSKIVGFVGGMQIPLIKKFEAGYRAGVAHVCKECRVLAAYAGTTPRAFNDTPKGQQLASAQYGQGADVIFHAAGKSGDGVFAAARQRGLFAIGVDLDQHSAAACCVVTSMLKRVDVAVVDAIRSVVEGRFAGGVTELGLAEHGVGFVADEHNRVLLPPAIVAKAQLIADQIVAGAIEVPSK
jgi:basic membrane protein A